VRGLLSFGRSGCTNLSGGPSLKWFRERIFANYFERVEVREAAQGWEGEQAMKSRTTRNIQIEKQTRRVLRKAAGAERQSDAKPTAGRKAKKSRKGGAAK
jgi:hypothetical protein